MYDPSPYPHERVVRRSMPVWPFLVLLILLAVGLGAMAYWLAPTRAPQSQPRTVTPAGDLGADEKATIQLFKVVSPSVVHVTNLTEQRDFSSLNVQQVPRGTGTGFVWDTDGHIVTNYHVVKDANVVHVIFQDGTSYESRDIVGYADKDIAVIRISASRDRLMPIAVGSSHDLQVGQKTFAIGNPFGLDQSLTTGIVSALGREIDSVTDRPIRNVIQTSAAINPGNSGGPLLDSSARLIGMNTSIISPSGAFAGIGFAIPVDDINQVVPQLISHGKVVRPRLGVQIAAKQAAEKFGVTEGALIWSITPESPAEKVGLRGMRRDSKGTVQTGDVIVAINGQAVKTGNDLFALLEKFKPGDTIRIGYLRDGERKEAQVTLDRAG
jgi:S1-C subfamily serine protease